MPKRKPVQKKKTNKLLFWLTGACALGFVLIASGFGFAANMEQKDSFCASCHTQPETTYFARSTAAQPVDLASAHTPKETRCIDCHSGSGVPGRVSAELLGARNAALWYSGNAIQPAKLTAPIGDGNCLKCHQQVTVQRDRSNHFHYFLTRWQAADPNAATCVTCHPGHSTDVDVQQRYLNTPKVEQQCQACHNTLGGGD
jgi:nitrate/TMAO reductase-like tetraheme cytochrome c subunit